MSRVGIIPAGGKAIRWQGLPKECLPIGNGSTLLSNSIKTLHRLNCNPIVIVTTPEREQVQKYVLGDWGDVEYIHDENGIYRTWIEACRQYPADEYAMMMPDTLLNMDTPPAPLDHELLIGVFSTTEPERFGTLRDEGVVDKEPSDKESELAWGFLMWTKKVADFWLNNGFTTQSEALTAAAKRFPTTTSDLHFYYDIGSYEHYLAYLYRRHFENRDSDS
jgi:dTDP-glucose pyrophosphorylase